MGHSFIQKTKSRVFFSRSGGKKYNPFFFPGKVHKPFIQNLARSNVFFNKLDCFFLGFFGFFLFFFSWKSSQCHSFIRFQSCFFFFGSRKKNRFFIQSIHFTQKSSKNELCRGKKNTVPLGRPIFFPQKKLFCRKRLSLLRCFILKKKACPRGCF